MDKYERGPNDAFGRALFLAGVVEKNRPHGKGSNGNWTTHYDEHHGLVPAHADGSVYDPLDPLTARVRNLT